MQIFKLLKVKIVSYLLKDLPTKMSHNLIKEWSTCSLHNGNLSLIFHYFWIFIGVKIYLNKLSRTCKCKDSHLQSDFREKLIKHIEKQQKRSLPTFHMLQSKNRSFFHRKNFEIGNTAIMWSLSLSLKEKRIFLQLSVFYSKKAFIS